MWNKIFQYSAVFVKFSITFRASPLPLEYSLQKIDKSGFS